LIEDSTQPKQWASRRSACVWRRDTQGKIYGTLFREFLASFTNDPGGKDAPATPDDELGAGFKARPLVYGLVYNGLGTLAGNPNPLRLSCKCWKNKRADERTRNADLISSYEFACVHTNASYCIR
jgi:hypothetical protein